MDQKTKQIDEAIQIFLESINETNLRAVEIKFEEIDKNEIGLRALCEWVWDSDKQRLVFKCY